MAFKAVFSGILAAALLAAPVAAKPGHGNGHGNSKFRGSDRSGHHSYGHRDSGHKYYGHRDSGHRYYGHGDSGHKYYGHGHSGYKSHGYRYPTYRRYGHSHFRGYGYRGHGHHYNDEAFLWLGLTAIGLKVLDVFNDEQQRRFEAAHWQAATAPIGQSIVWTSGSSAVAVTPVREGYDDGGRLCREFQQEIRVGGRTERGWGTACLQADGSWRMAY